MWPANSAIIRFGGGVALWVADFALVALSDATNTYAVRAGFIDSITAEPTDGAYFRYTHGTNSGRWQAVCRNNNTETAVDTGVTAAITTFNDFEIVVNAAASSVEFKIGGVVVATIATNIPTAAGRETGYGIAVIRSVGTAALNAIDIDFQEVTVDFTTSR